MPFKHFEWQTKRIGGQNKTFPPQGSYMSIENWSSPFCSSPLWLFCASTLFSIFWSFLLKSDVMPKTIHKFRKKKNNLTILEIIFFKKYLDSSCWTWDDWHVGRRCAGEGRVAHGDEEGPLVDYLGAAGGGAEDGAAGGRGVVWESRGVRIDSGWGQFGVSNTDSVWSQDGVRMGSGWGQDGAVIMKAW